MQLQKVGMEMLTKTEALEIADKGIQLNGIALGAIAISINKELLEAEEKRKDKGKEKELPIHRIG
jgi:NAD(P)-dependent dehydrogenase (short-subunit alcohol dehydrogenase family)